MVSTENESKEISISNIMLVPVIFAIAIIPLIIRFIIYDSHITEYTWYSEVNESVDIFMYYKRNAMMFLDAMLLLGFAFLLKRRQLPKTRAFIPLAIYFVLILLSSFVSVSPYHTWYGFEGMLESAFVLFGYCMICYYTYAVIKSEETLKIVMFAFGIGILILCIIGFTQFIGQNFLLTEIGKDILFSNKYEHYKNALVSKFEEGRVSSTLFNPNYMGVYCCLVIPLLLILMFTVTKKKYIFGYMILLALVSCCLVGSGSKTAIITLIPCLVFLLFYFGRKQKKKVIRIAVIGILIFTILNIYQGEASVFMKVISRFGAGYVPDKEYAIKDITLGDESFTITYKKTLLTLMYKSTEDSGYELEVKKGDALIPLEYSKERKMYYLKDNAFNELGFIPLKVKETQIGYQISSEGCEYNICYSSEDETYYYVNAYGRCTKLYSSESFDIPLFHLMGGFSGRDYIWAKSIPLLKQTLFLGSGPDTYAFMFPQYDYVAATQNGYASTTITKPHNTYLQIGIQTGVLSLLSYVVFYGWYFVQSIQIYRKRELLSFTERCGAGIFAASICYMTAGFINDSTIGVSVVFWVLMGLGHACNHMIKEQETAKIELPQTQRKWTIGHIMIVCIILIILVLAAHIFMNRNDEEPTDGRAKFEAQISVPSVEQEQISYNAVMNMEWTFFDGKSVSTDAYVENAATNNNAVYFDVWLLNEEVIYTSPVIEVGETLESIVLEKELVAGGYEAVVTYHLLDENKNEVGTAEVEITIQVLH